MTEQNEIQFLTDIGCPPVIPSVRSSDADNALFDPFGYYLKRRLGIQPAATESKAFRDGKWLHHHFEISNCNPDHYDAFLDAKLLAVREEVTDRCRRGGVSEASLQHLLAAEAETMVLTGAWLDVALDVPLPDYGSFRQFLDHDRWLEVSREGCYDLRSDLGLWLTVKPDLLLLDTNSHKLYVVDLKSTGEPTEVRAATCPFEFQSWHYVYTLAELLARGALQEIHGLPEDTVMGGMYHLLMEKPPIRMNKTHDSYFRYVAHGKKTKRMGRAVPQTDSEHWKVESWPDDQGPYTAVVEKHSSEERAIAALHKMCGIKPKKEYDDEPSPVLYTERCARWYKAEGEYKHLAIERPNPVEISFTDGDLMTDPEQRREYYESLLAVADVARRQPIPRNFQKNYSKLRAYKQISPYAGFYVNPVENWPEIIARNHFIVEYRDDPNAYPTDGAWQYRAANGDMMVDPASSID